MTMSPAEAAALEEAADLVAEALGQEFPSTRKERHMANPNMALSNPNVDAVRPTIADTLAGAVSALGVAANELSTITDRLCGSQPEPDVSKLRGVADGAFAQIDMSRADIEAITETILGNTSRIRGRL